MKRNQFSIVPSHLLHHALFVFLTTLYVTVFNANPISFLFHGESNNTHSGENRNPPSYFSTSVEWSTLYHRRNRRSNKAALKVPYRAYFLPTHGKNGKGFLTKIITISCTWNTMNVTLRWKLHRAATPLANILFFRVMLSNSILSITFVRSIVSLIFTSHRFVDWEDNSLVKMVESFRYTIFNNMWGSFQKHFNCKNKKFVSNYFNFLNTLILLLSANHNRQSPS